SECCKCCDCTVCRVSSIPLPAQCKTKGFAVNGRKNRDACACDTVTLRPFCVQNKGIFLLANVDLLTLTTSPRYCVFALR
ncbi:AGAP009149-PA, partial [Anopheles gambiae str. PEST]